MIMKRLLIHIGTGKTGTSSIQNFLYANRKKLAEQFGLHYPGYGLSKIDHFGEVIHAHYPVVTWIKDRQTQRLKTLSDSLNSSSCDIAVISCENLYHHLTSEDIAFLANAIKGFSVEIICYVRRQDLYMESAWKQQVKVGALSTPFPDFLRQHAHSEHLEKVHGNYYRMLLPWANTFGFENVKVRVFDKSEWVNGDLIDDFLNTCGLEVDKAISGLEKSQITNTAMPSELIMLVRKVNATHAIPKHEQQKFVTFLNKLRIFNEKPLLSTTERLAIIGNYQQANSLLFSEFGKRPVPECFFPSAVKEAVNESSSKDISVEDIAARTIARIWNQSSPDVSFKLILRMKAAKEALYKLIKWCLSYFIILRNIIQAKGYAPSVIEPNKINQPSPFVMGGRQSPTEVDECEGFYFYGFSKLPTLKTNLISSLPRHSITVNDCFVSAARITNQPDKSKVSLGALYENGQIIKAASFRGPTPALRSVDPITVDQKRINQSRFIPGTCVYMGWLLHNFGHLLLEAPARFWILESIDVTKINFVFHPLNYRRDITGYIPVSNILEDSFTRILCDSFGISKQQILLADQDLCVEELIIPSPLFFLNQTVDPSQLSIYKKIKAHLIQNHEGKPDTLTGTEVFDKEKIYFSRRLLKKAIQNRKAKNEDAIEQLFISYGFEIVYPEQLSFQEQVQLLSKADVVAGCEGSALHMGVFMPPSAKMIILTTRGIVTNQLLVSALANIETHFIHAGIDRSALYTTGIWEADIPFIKENLEKIINATIV